MNKKFVSNMRSKQIFGTIILGALAAILEILPINIPLYKFLAINVTGVPLLLAFYVFGLSSGIVSTFIVSFTIVFSGFFFKDLNFIRAFFRGLAELATLAGIYASKPFWKNTKRLVALSFICGSIMRAIVMCLANYAITPVVLSLPREVVLPIIPIIFVFNIVQTTVNIFIAILIYEKLRILIPSLLMEL